jgi:hypothetical protein
MSEPGRGEEGADEQSDERLNQGEVEDSEVAASQGARRWYSDSEMKRLWCTDAR